MGFLENIFGYSNIDSAIERAASLKDENQVSVKEIKELIEIIDNYNRSRSEWAHGVGVPGGHSKMSIYTDYSIVGTKDKLESVLIISEAMDDVYVRDDFKFMLDEIEITKHGLF